MHSGDVGTHWITAAVVDGRMTFEGPPPYPDGASDLSLRDLFRVLNDEGWEIAPPAMNGQLRLRRVW
jgi:hypothetical protein